jgi:hypothetical protein
VFTNVEHNPATLLARSSCAFGGWSMLSRPDRAVRRSKLQSWRETGRVADVIAAADRKPGGKRGDAIGRELGVDRASRHIPFLAYLCVRASSIGDAAHPPSGQ